MEEPFLGSTSERVRRKALVPVMITKKPLSSEAKTFLVPTDFSSCAKRAAAEAINLAMRFGGRVVSSTFCIFHIGSHMHTSWVYPCRFHRLRLKKSSPSGKPSSPVCP